MEQAEAGINQISDVVQSNSANAEETSATRDVYKRQSLYLLILLIYFLSAVEHLMVWKKLSTVVWIHHLFVSYTHLRALQAL